MRINGRLKPAALILMAAAIGLCWPSAIWVSLLLPLVWAASTSRSTAFLIILAHQLAASRGLPPGAAVFFGEAPSTYIYGIMVWSAASLLTALPYGLLRFQKAHYRALGLIAALTLHALSPVGWSHPLTGLGAVLPGGGWVAILAVMAAWCGFAMRHRLMLAMSLLAATLTTVITPVIAQAPGVTWRGVDTHYAKLSGGFDPMASFARVQFVQQLAREVPMNSVTVLPETILGQWNPFVRETFRDTEKILDRKHALILVGAETPEPGTTRTWNALVQLGGRGANLTQRIPVPIAMWQPWTKKDGTIADLFGRGIVEVQETPAAYAICYEQLLTAPILLSFFPLNFDTWPKEVRIKHVQPTVLIGAANAWWARGTSIPEIQRASMNSWGRLFGVPVILATNV